MSGQNRYCLAVAAHLLLSDGAGRVLFMRRANTGYADGQWSLPAGHVEPGESLPQTCLRETVEETGLRLHEAALQCVLVQHKHDLDGQERIDAFFTATLPVGQTPTVREPEKCDALQWFSLEDLPDPLIAYIAAAITAITSEPRPVLALFGFDDQ